MSEGRVAWLLILVLLAQLVLVSHQADDPAGGGLVERSALWLVAPWVRMVTGLERTVSGLRHRFTDRQSLRRENRRLRGEVEDLQREVLRLRDAERRAERLAEALDYSHSERENLRPADVVFADPTAGSGSLVVYGGGAELEPNQPVVAPGGLVGRVVQVAGPYAKVQLLTDRSATAGAMVERTRRQGLVRGGPQGKMELSYVPLQADVRVGDRVRTSGIDGVYPPGLPVGNIISVEPGEALFQVIRLEPAVELGTLNRVYVLDRREVPEELKDGDDAGG